MCTSTGYTPQNIELQPINNFNANEFYRYNDGETTKEFKKFILCNTINEEEDDDSLPDESKKDVI